MLEGDPGGAAPASTIAQPPACFLLSFRQRPAGGLLRSREPKGLFVDPLSKEAQEETAPLRSGIHHSLQSAESLLGAGPSAGSYKGEVWIAGTICFQERLNVSLFVMLS